MHINKEHLTCLPVLLSQLSTLDLKPSISSDLKYFFNHTSFKTLTTLYQVTFNGGPIIYTVNVTQAVLETPCII